MIRVPSSRQPRPVFAKNQQSTHLCLAPLDSSEIPNLFVKHDFRAGNSCLFWELRSIGRRPLEWLESQRIKPTFSRTTTLAAFKSEKLDICRIGG
jgi:hypothetical protein